MSTILLCSYNNYYNRRVYRDQTLNDYVEAENYRFERINFNPNDGVNTTIVLNCADDKSDYLVELNEYGEINSRWFIIEAVRIRKGQYEFTLHRDVIADNYDELIAAPIFVEKATLEDDDPFIFNDENMTFNQIKQSETLLKDQSNCPWIVGYVSKKTGDDKDSFDGIFDADYSTDIAADITLSGDINTWEFYPYVDNYVQGSLTKGTFEVSYRPTVGAIEYKTLRATVDLNYNWVSGAAVITENSTYPGPTTSRTDEQLVNSSKGAVKGLAQSYATFANLDKETFSDIFALNNKVIAYTTAEGLEYKKIKTQTTLATIKSTAINQSNGGSLYTAFMNYCSNIGMTVSGNYTDAFYVSSEQTMIKIVLEDTQPAEGTAKMTATNYTKDAPYDVFCAPYSDSFVFHNFERNATGSSSNKIDYTPDKELTLAAAIGLARKGGTAIYDLQLLPYCPIPYLLDGESIDLAQLDSDVGALDYFKDNQNNNVGCFIKVRNATFSFDILLDQPVIITEPKIQALTDMYRLCSPNYAGVFEFNAAKNNGITFFNVDCTYLPYTPYIHVNPDFGGLYGKDFNDVRGLNCGGDFSLPRISNNWDQYQIDNKNYQQSFDRQIQNMEIKNKYGLMQDIGSAITGVGAGAAGGAIAGSSFGPMGTAIGAVAGGVMSAGGGIADVIINQKLRNEEIDYTKDQFGFQLGNIQAMPNGLSKTTAYTANNKYFPFLEYYTCTDVEKEALRNKIKYNGMTVGRIGTIDEFIKPYETYIKGKLIRTNISEDYHLIKAIAAELNMGVFIRRED